VSFRLFPWPFTISLIDSFAARAAGVVLVSSGFALFILGLMALGNSWRLGIDAKAPGTLVTRGIYSFSRNPIYSFFDLYLLGTFLINGTLVFLVFALLVVVNLHYQIIGEEKFLRKIYGKTYQDYLDSTGRYFSWRKLTDWLTGRSPEAAEI
jgi:protein-S-isoprenylcysteine O-methyltransferase Ste14